MELTKENYYSRTSKRDGKLRKWILNNPVFTITIGLALFFSIINIFLIMNFLNILINF